MSQANQVTAFPSLEELKKDVGQVRNIRFEAGGVEYTWSGGYGSIITSFERGRNVGDVRMICGVPFHVYLVHRKGFRFFGKMEVSWTIPNSIVSSEWIREFRRAVFCNE